MKNPLVVMRKKMQVRRRVRTLRNEMNEIQAGKREELRFTRAHDPGVRAGPKDKNLEEWQVTPDEKE